MGTITTGSGGVSSQEKMKRWPGSCFACSNPAGLQLEFRHFPDGAETTCVVSAAYCGFDGVVHGGIITTILDETSCWAIFARLGRLGVTQKMTTQYHRLVRTETELSVTARIASHDPRHAQVHAEISDAGGTVLAESESSWVFPRLSRIASLAGVDEKMLQTFLDSCCADQ